MSIANLLQPNDYLLYINQDSIQETSCKVTMAGNDSAVGAATIELGATIRGGPGYLAEWNIGGFIINNSAGSIKVPKSGKYLVIIKISYLNENNASLLVTNDFKMTDGALDIVLESMNSYMSPNVSTLELQTNFSNIVSLTAGTSYFITATITNNGINTTYIGNASEEKTTWALYYLGN